MKKYLERDLGMTEDKIHKCIPSTRLSKIMNWFVKNRHNTHFFLEIFLCFTFFIELRVGTRKSNTHIDKSISHEHLICQTNNPQRNPNNKDKSHYIQKVISNIDNTIPEIAPKSIGSLLCLCSRTNSYGIRIGHRKCKQHRKSDINPLYHILEFIRIGHIYQILNRIFTLQNEEKWWKKEKQC